jgi:hypothetical protein
MTISSELAPPGLSTSPPEGAWSGPLPTAAEDPVLANLALFQFMTTEVRRLVAASFVPVRYSWPVGPGC